MAGRKDQVARPGNGKGCSCTTLRKATRRISQLYDTALAPSGLKTTQHAILAQIGRSEPTTVGELAGALVMDSGALAHTLKPLERDSLVAVAVDPGDRRNRLITLTGKSSRPQGQRPSISSTSVQLRKVRTKTSPARSPRLVNVSSMAIVFTISAATSTSRPSSSERPMRIL